MKNPERIIGYLEGRIESLEGYEENSYYASMRSVLKEVLDYILSDDA